MTEPETPEETIEKTETGYRLTVTSKRGTGTRDEDKVQATVKTRTLSDLLMEQNAIKELVTGVMNDRRSHDPDGEGESEQ